MKKYEVFDLFASQLASVWKNSFVFGVLSLLFGIAIIFFPQILIALVATFFIATGIVSIIIAWNMRKYKDLYYDTFRFNLDNLF